MQQLRVRCMCNSNSSSAYNSIWHCILNFKLSLWCIIYNKCIRCITSYYSTVQDIQFVQFTIQYSSSDSCDFRVPDRYEVEHNTHFYRTTYGAGHLDSPMVKKGANFPKNINFFSFDYFFMQTSALD